MRKNRHTVWFDGSCWPNPGGRAGWGFLVTCNDALIHKAFGEYIPTIHGETSNNVAEYQGLIHALTWLEKASMTRQPVLVLGDSDLVIQQMFGRWRVKRGIYARHAYDAMKLRRRFSIIEGRWIPREKNHAADELSKQYLDGSK